MFSLMHVQQNCHHVFHLATDACKGCQLIYTNCLQSIKKTASDKFVTKKSTNKKHNYKTFTCLRYLRRFDSY